MSVQLLATVFGAKITPASASFEAAAVEPSPATAAPEPAEQQQPEDNAKNVAAADADNAIQPAQQEQGEGGAAEAPNAAPSNAEQARNNWLELRARVESVDPRVFAFREDPKYLQQCAEAKQRRTAAATTHVTPAWH
ncbi:hypothetical protein PHYSODRAFT_328139 [Phytophthora sojae]|uniref:Uncharacterized protein n=1 Tax=Phytophthora sojae (strain P6497) TaxID=1094619 RepID=G4Z1W9_PHYSP|nr:hypothetical protein PHYSODRAFT_328139 [Phytophthora sojae]EGZ19967.1 hypothetical protein PHYSODRAFT_328139 [Phytophthora sojae]|eukprot:XP_009522684.1 hypothetical protein PHYSODRAFT_328139 [Phytophthora sojae]